MVSKIQRVCSGLLCPIRNIGKGVEVLLTRREFWHERKQQPRTFPGEWVFTGGTAEPEDRDLLETAIREFGEELDYKGKVLNANLFYSATRHSYGKLYHLEFYAAQIDKSYELNLTKEGRVELMDVKWFSPESALKLICSEEFTQQQLWQYKKRGFDNPKYGAYSVSFRQFPVDVVNALRKIETKGRGLLAD